MSKKKTKNNKIETKLSQHKRHRKQLTPPFLQLPALSPSSWVNERLPEMLWAALVVGNMEREEALAFFRYISDFVKKNPDCWDVTLTGIGTWDKEKQASFFKHIEVYSLDVKPILRPLVLFEGLPAKSDWEAFLGAASDEDGGKLADGVSVTFWHQSQAATDCRWIRLLAIIYGGKLHFPVGKEEHVLELIEYPNRGDQRRVRPSIRAAELTYTAKKPTDWVLSFWKECYEKTSCHPEEAVNEKLKKRREGLIEEAQIARTHYLTHAKSVRDTLITHLLNTSTTSSIDSRHEGAYGLALYGMAIFMETIFYRTSMSITGRISLRLLLEVYIIFEYILKKEKTEPGIWDTYRAHGVGQIKLIYLKLEESLAHVSCINRKELEYNVNEDRWIEFTPINLGHWDGVDLRKMSEEVGLKALYDSYHDYASGFTHGTWGAIRESVYQRCMNPLHRFHRIPTFDAPLMPSIFDDACNLTNKILDCVSRAYPEFKGQIRAPEVDMSCHV